MHIEVVGLFKPSTTLVTGKIQLCFSLVFGHMVLEGGPLAALEATNFTPRMVKWDGAG